MRRGYGKGKGQGYKNLMPMDSYVHSMSALGVKVLPLQRVPYGKKSTPKSKREYKIQHYGSPVGTIKEWKEFAKKNNLDRIHVNENDGSHYYVDLDAKRVRELGKTTRLEVEQAITVPSTEFDKPISPAKFQKRVDEVQTYLAKTFGGETTVTGQGGYVAESGKLIPEKVKVVTSFADDKDFEQNVAKVYQKIKDWKKQWKQETVAYMVENDLYLI